VRVIWDDERSTRGPSQVSPKSPQKWMSAPADFGLGAPRAVLGWQGIREVLPESQQDPSLALADCLLSNPQPASDIPFRLAAPEQALNQSSVVFGKSRHGAHEFLSLHRGSILIVNQVDATSIVAGRGMASAAEGVDPFLAVSRQGSGEDSVIYEAFQCRSAVGLEDEYRLASRSEALGVDLFQPIARRPPRWGAPAMSSAHASGPDVGPIGKSLHQHSIETAGNRFLG
jgi:hypothetical protein